MKSILRRTKVRKNRDKEEGMRSERLSQNEAAFFTSCR